VARCPVPVVTGVGHETDFTIVDWVADVRAPTPSAAAAAAVPDRSHLAEVHARKWWMLVVAIRARISERSEIWRREREVLRRLAPSSRLAAQRRQLESARRALFRAAVRRAEVHRAGFARLVAGLQSLSPLAVLARGYALVERRPEGTLLRRAEDVAPGDRIGIRLSLGEIRAVVEASEGEPGAE
ncbi:MAG: exodeoxyribonuclease VII large subunit, partial [Myxococcota bacterium]